METLVILYFIYLASGTIGQGKVSVLDIARWMRTTKPTVKKHMDKLLEIGFVRCEIQYSNGKEYRWLYSLGIAGNEHLDEFRSQAYDLYRIHVEKTIQAIKAANRHSENAPITKRQSKRESAGQKRLL